MQRNITKEQYKYLLGQLTQLINSAPNTTFSEKNIVKPIIQASIDNASIESVCNYLRMKGIDVPTGNDVFHHLTRDKLKVTEVYSCMHSMLKESLSRAKKHINFRTSVNIAVDYHVVPYYGEGGGELAIWVKGCKNKQGTNKGLHYITAHIVDRGRRLTIAVLPVSVFDNTPDLVERLIEEVRRYIDIRYVFLDRGFYSVGGIQKLIDLDLRFVIPVVKYKGKKKNKKIVQLMKDNYSQGNERFRYTLSNKDKQVTFTVMVKKDEDGKVVGFATNTKLRAKTIGDWYGKRWGIETGYRVKEGLRARTCSQKPGVRLLVNMFPFVLYNLWVLVNLALRYLVGGGRYLENDQSYMTAYDLCKRLEEFIQGG